MKTRNLYERILFQSLIVFSLGATLYLLSSNVACKKQEEEKKPTKPEVTIENLQTAYAKSLNYERMYNLFAQRAKKDRLLNVANLYRAVARSEAIHAALHADLLRKQGVEPRTPQIDSVTVGTTLQTLKYSVSSEEIEFGRMYANLIRTAELEKFSEAQSQFQMTMEVDQQHADLFKEAFDRNGLIQKVPYFVCSGCGYILTSEKTEECPVCHSTKEKFEKI